ncbi:hypothetical protein BpHYR1_014609 [Brachionus plicatilis]|uniref:Uncharacterized protein n=1 Tax=Brachionus plicatilis TaxID=10195 RepID=A0A3M7QIY2_BRAPC|nr:hypothetical protein BpHYR1_014609 [Brachionus plicatilis]
MFLPILTSPKLPLPNLRPILNKLAITNCLLLFADSSADFVSYEYIGLSRNFFLRKIVSVHVVVLSITTTSTLANLNLYRRSGHLLINILKDFTKAYNYCLTINKSKQ